MVNLVAQERFGIDCNSWIRCSVVYVVNLPAAALRILVRTRSMLDEVRSTSYSGK